MANVSHEDETHQQDDRIKMEKFKTMVEKQNDRVNNLQKAAFQLANYYFVSQAVVFSAISGDSSSLLCRDVWFPLVLSLVPAFLNFFALVVIGNEYRRAIECREKYTCQLEEYVRKKTEGGNSGRVIAADPVLKRRITFNFYACMVAFAFFAIVVAFGCFWILCGDKKIVKHRDDNDDANCVKLCDKGKCIRICP